MSKYENDRQREKSRRRIRSAQDPDRYYYAPPKDTVYARADDYQRVAIYARVSTLNPMQTSSYELQQKYYTDMVSRYPKWELVNIYADEGKSGVTTEHRDGFNQMMEDAMKGKFDLLITKSISRLNRNVSDLLKTVRMLAEKKIGILFESEAVYSLNDANHLALSFQASVAEEESRIRSRSMEASLRMRLDHGLPLTPELLGFVKNEDGKLEVNPETYKIPKLMFYMYLYGYSTQQIADTLTRLSKRTYLGNMKWTASGVAKSLQNERYCGDVLTRKRYRLFAADVFKQKSFKNRGEKPQSYYKGEHDEIVSRDDFLAVQRIMANAKYGGTTFIPELKVIPDGILKGFVIIHPKWGTFTKEDYISASAFADSGEKPDEIMIEVRSGEFDLRDYEVADVKLFDEQKVPSILLQENGVRFSMSCVKGMACGDYIEILVHPIQKRIAIRPTTEDNRCAVRWTSGSKTSRETREISGKAFIDTLFQIFGWSLKYRYRLFGCIYKDGNDSACVFTGTDSSVYIRKEELISSGIDASGRLLNQSGEMVRVLSGNLGERFGQDYYVEKTMNEMMLQTKEQWQTRLEGQLCPAKNKLNVTPYDKLRTFIREEMGDLFEEVQPA